MYVICFVQLYLDLRNFACRWRENTEIVIFYEILFHFVKQSHTRGIINVSYIFFILPGWGTCLMTSLKRSSICSVLRALIDAVEIQAKC